MADDLFDFAKQLSAHDAGNLEVLASKFFQPRTPITTQELFAGRWPEITKLADVITQPGLHAILYGERGVGKTSLANVIGPIIQILFDKTPPSKDHARLVAKVITDSKDTFSTIWLKIFDEIAWRSDSEHFGLKRGKLREKQSVTQAWGLNDKIGVNEVRRILLERSATFFL